MWAFEKSNTRGRQFSTRGGFAVRELLLVTGVIGVLAVALIWADPNNSAAPEIGVTGGVEAISAIEIPLGKEFLCMVRVDRFGKAGSHDPPTYVSRARIARRQWSDRAFLLEIVTNENANWNLATCRTWTIMPRGDVDSYLLRHHQAATADPQLTAEERWAAENSYNPPAVESVKELDEPLVRCVPADLRENGMLVVTGNSGLHNLSELSDFPLASLAAAIRSAAERDRWTSEPTRALLPKSQNEPLSLFGHRGIAESRVLRLVEFLPGVGAATDARGVSEGQGN